MATDPDDITAGQLVTPETMQKWTDSIREVQQLTPGLAGRGSQATTQSFSIGWARLNLATTEYNGTGLSVVPQGISIPATGYYQVFARAECTNTSANALTTPSRRGLGVTTSPTLAPDSAGLNRLQYTVDVRAVPNDQVLSLLTVSDELFATAGNTIALWFFQSTNASIDVGYRKITVRRVG